MGDGQREEGRSSLSFNAWIAIAVGLLVVIVLSLHVPVLLRYRQEQKAVAAIARLGKGATCTIAGCAPPWPMSVLAHKWKPYGRLFDRAVRAELGYPATATNADVALLAGLTELQELDLGGTQVTDAGVEGLERKLPDCPASVGNGQPPPVARELLSCRHRLFGPSAL